MSCQGSGIKSESSEDSSFKLLKLEPSTRSTTSLCESVSTSESDEVTNCCCIFLTGLPKLLTIHRIVQQAANERFDYCNFFSFLLFAGDLVIGKVQ